MITPQPRRTIFTTLLGVLGILAGGLGSLFSLFALLLAMGMPYANSSSDPLGIFLIFILPPGTLLASIGLLLRHRWARWWMILLMAGLVGLGVKGLLAPDHANPSYAPQPGPAAEAMERRVATPLSYIAIGGFVLLGLFSRPVRREFAVAGETAPHALPQADPAGDWRVGHTGRDMMFYEEHLGGEWRRIEIDGEMLTGRAHHVIYFANPETWQRYPEWARHRRDEIIARIKSRFSAPDYEYAEGGTASMPAEPPIPAARPNLPSNDGSILPMLALLVVAAAACFWFAARGLEQGKVRLSAKHNPASRVVYRAEKPALFWASLGILTLVGSASSGFAGWLVIVRLRDTARKS